MAHGILCLGKFGNKMSCGYKKTQAGAHMEGNGEPEHYLMSHKLDTNITHL